MLLYIPKIDLTYKVKEELEKFKEKEGVKTYSDAVNLLLRIAKEKERRDRLEDLI